MHREGVRVSVFITWSGAAAPIVCRVCDWEGVAQAAAHFDDTLGEQYTARRCERCGSLAIVDRAKDSSPDEVSVDHYLEYGAGIGTIVEELGRVDPRTVRSFLDVGCNYGHSLDFARSVFGWDVLGIEPSRSGARGAAELGVEIVTGYLEHDTDLGRTFDLILSSEVLEHVPDPAGFLLGIKNQLADGGTVLLTTPAAEIVVPDRSDSEALVALSPGYHVFLATADSLRGLLARAGFGWVRVTRVDGSLRAMARVESSPPALSDGIPAGDVESYYRTILDRSGSATSLRLGAATRLLRSLVARGEFGSVDPVIAQLHELVTALYGVDLDLPEEQLLSPSGAVPGALPGIAFAIGMVQLLRERDDRRAAEYFALSSRAIEVWLSAIGHPDLDLIDLREQSAYHRLLALSRVEPAITARGAVTLADQSPIDRASGRERLAARRARLLVELVAHDERGDHSELAALVAPEADRLVASIDREVVLAGRDALYALGMEELRHGHSEGARRWFDAAIEVCLLHPDDAHAGQLLALCEDTKATLGAAPEQPATQSVGPPPLLRRLRRALGRARRRLRGDAPAPASAPSAAASVTHMLDVYWSNTDGTFLQGWAHVDGTPASSITIRHGGASVVAQQLERADLLALWPNSAEVVRSGFSAYLPGPPEPVTEWVLTIGDEQHVMRKRAPLRALPELPAAGDADDAKVRIQALIAAAPPGPVLALGVRGADEAAAQLQRTLFGDREVIGVDIHDGFGVDVVADAHRLSDVFERNRFAIVCSASVLEHVAAPWLVARESALVLMPGGIAVNNVPWLWPTHAQPNDFWRFSQQGLELLYGPDLGFETVDSGGVSGVRAFPEPEWVQQSLSYPTLISAATAWCVSRKVSDAAADVSWPYDPEAGERFAKNYPEDGLAL